MEVIRTSCRICRAAKYLIHMERALMTKHNQLGSVYSGIHLIYDPELGILDYVSYVSYEFTTSLQ